MGLLDGALRSVASVLIGKFGTAVRLRKIVSGVFQPGTGEAANTEIVFDLKGTISDYTQFEVRGDIQSGDKKVDIAAKDLDEVPDSSWEVDLLMSGEWVPHEIVLVNPVMATDEVALIRITARGRP